MRRVITGDVDGRSRVIVDGDAPVVGDIDEIWAASPAVPMGVDPVEWENTLEPPPGGIRFRVAAIPPHSPRFHVTDTVDYLYVLDGDLTLELDDGEVVLHPGDTVVQRRTSHAWRNDNDFPVRLVAVMVSLASDG
jgi:quercetin dioxygenase-like cupin family protein